MKIGAFSSILAFTYTDTMSIYRHQNITNTDGTSGIIIPEKPLYSQIKCRLSFESRDYPETDLEDSNPIKLQLKVFCEPSIDIQKGDKLIINKLDDYGNIMMTYEGIANLPFVYTTHKEIEIIQTGDA